MRNDIREKLQSELNKPITGEPQVVYILSRARKILEIEGKEKEKEYGVLKFYCDWALHASINNTVAVRNILDGIVARDGEAGLKLTMQFTAFHEDFQKFLHEYGLATTIYEYDANRFPLEKFMSQIYDDTPLIIDGKTEVRWYGQAGENSFGGSFKVRNLMDSAAQDASEYLA